jgi:hypothetical protein
MISTPFRPDLEDREHQVLLAQRRCALDPISSAIATGRRGVFLEFFQMHVSSLFLGSGLELVKLVESWRRQDAAAEEDGRRE